MSAISGSWFTDCSVTVKMRDEPHFPNSNNVKGLLLSRKTFANMDKSI